MRGNHAGRGRLKIGAPTSSADPRQPHPGRATDAPLDLFVTDATRIDRRDVNLRWLCASALTGLTGAGLIGAAIYVSLQGDVSFAAVPEHAEIVVRPAPSDDTADLARKGDRLVRNLMIASAKQTFRSPVTVRLGEREIIKVRPFVRISTALSMSTGVFSAEVPRFDPMKFVSSEPLERASEPSAADAPGAEVTVIKRDLTTMPIEASTPALGDDAVTAQVEEEKRLAAEAGRRTALPIAPQLMLSRALQQGIASPDFGGMSPASGDASPFKSIEVLVVPENVTNLAKTSLRQGETPLVEDRDLAIKRGDTLEALLKATGQANDEQIKGIVAALGGRARVGELAEGQQFPRPDRTGPENPAIRGR